MIKHVSARSTCSPLITLARTYMSHNAALQRKCFINCYLLATCLNGLTTNTKVTLYIKNGQRWPINMKRCSRALTISKIKIKTTVRYHLTYVRIAIINQQIALTRVVQLVGCCPAKCKVPGLISSQGTLWVHFLAGAHTNGAQRVN